MGKVVLATPRIQAKTEIQEEGSLQIHFFFEENGQYFETRSSTLKQNDILKRIL